MRIYDSNAQEKKAVSIGIDISSVRHASSTAGIESVYGAGIVNTSAQAAVAMTANQLLLVPFISPSRGRIIDRLSYNVTGAAAGSGTIGIYNNIAPNNLYPSGLFFQHQIFDNAVVANKGGSQSIRLILKPSQLYWAAFWSSSAVTTRNIGVAATVPIMGFSDNGAAAGPGRVYYRLARDFTTNLGVLPNPLPIGASVVVGTSAPGVWMRFCS